MKYLATFAAAAALTSLAGSASALTITIQSDDSAAPASASQPSGTTGTASITDADLGVAGLSVNANAETKPTLPPGGLGLPDALSLSSQADVVNDSGSDATVEVYFSESDYRLDPDPGAFMTDATANLGAFASGDASVTFDTFVDTGNTEYGPANVAQLESQATQVGTGLTLDDPLAIGSDGGTLDTGDEFSLTQRVTFDMNGNGSATGNVDTAATASPVPLPAVGLLLLPALGGLAALRRRA